MLKIIQSRLKKVIEERIPREQACFRQGRGTRDHIANLRWIMEFYMNGRRASISVSWTTPRPLTIWINHDFMWSYLKFLRVPPHIIAVLQALQRTGGLCESQPIRDIVLWYRKGPATSLHPLPWVAQSLHLGILRNGFANYCDKGIRIGGMVLNNLGTLTIQQCWLRVKNI